MKQKIVIEACIRCKKCKTEAMSIAAVEDGVISIAFEGKDKVVVIGEGVDAVNLTCSLRKKLKDAHIVSVEKVEEKETKPKGKGEGEAKPTSSVPPIICTHPCQYPHDVQHYKVVYDSCHSDCTIM